MLVKLPRFTSAYKNKLNKKGNIERSDEMYQLFKDQVLLTAWIATSIEIEEIDKALKKVAEEFYEFRKKQRNGENPPSQVSDEAKNVAWSKKTKKKTKRKRMTREEFLNESK